jgi:hypothetical protein
MNATTNLYALGLNEAAHLIATIGHQRTIILEGHIGTGKTSVEKLLAELKPTHRVVRFDCTNKDLGDLFLPNMADMNGEPFVRFIPNEELGVHLNEPIILNFDEIGKANPSVIKGVRRVMLERMVGTQKLHPDSIVFATTNLGAEGVGDLLPAHTRNAVCVVKTRKTDNMEAISYGLKNDFDPILLSWYKENEALFQTFDEVPNPVDNPYIYHPKDKSREAFFTPRSGEAASDILKMRDELGDDVTQAALIGTIGLQGALDLMAYVQLFDELPTLESIEREPVRAKVPTSASAIYLVVFKVLAGLKPKLLDSFMDYMLRLPKSHQATFVLSATQADYPHIDMCTQNAKFTQWTIDNHYLFQADQMGAK